MVTKRPKISVLISARKDSKYLAKFLFGLFENTSAGSQQNGDIEVLVMLNEHDTWNRELVSYFEGRSDIRFYYEDLHLGRHGLHKYFNLLAVYATGEWLIYFCEDHFITAPVNGSETWPAWDQYFLKEIKDRKLDYRDIYCIIPKFDNVGAMNQMLSRGYYEAIGSVMGRHGWIDSYINDLNGMAFTKHTDRIVRMDHETFHDFTHDIPSPMDQTSTQDPEVLENTKDLPKHRDSRYEQMLIADADKLRKVLEAER
jgi:hypothetical protein